MNKKFEIGKTYQARSIICRKAKIVSRTRCFITIDWYEVGQVVAKGVRFKLHTAEDGYEFFGNYPIVTMRDAK